MPSNPMQAMWMGPRGGEMWVKSPDSGGTFTGIGFAGTGQQGINGGFNQRRSKTSHMDYPMSWTIQNRLSASPLKDMYSGARGPGLIYFIDLMAADLNVLPSQWAFPAAACYDAVPLIAPVIATTGNALRPANVTSPTNAFGFPPETAEYQLVGVANPLYIPIPPGYSAWFGANGVFTGAANTGMRVTPILPGNLTGTPQFPTMIAANSAQLVNTEFQSASYQGIVLDVVPTPTITNLFKNPNGRDTITGYAATGTGALGRDVGSDTYFQASGVNTSGAGGITLQTLAVGTGLLPLTTYTFSATVLASAGSGAAISYVPKIQVSGTGLTTSVQTVGLATPFNRISVTFTTLASGNVTFSVLNTGASMATGNVVAFRDSQLEIGSVMNNYGDGSYPYWVWNGATDASTSTGVTPDLLDLTALAVQIIPTGVTPTQQGFIGGWGNSGCEFTGAPVITAGSSYRDFVGATAHLVEVGDWQ